MRNCDPASHGKTGTRHTQGLEEFLRELSIVLLTHGVSLNETLSLMRRAFVGAAAAQSRLKNGRVNHSRVAARTGLSRSVVRTLLQSTRLTESTLQDSPLHQVLHGWRTDRKFQKKGKPAALRISTKFRKLVARHGGDIPPRAMLSELIRIGAVTDDGLTVRLHSRRGCKNPNDLQQLLGSMARLARNQATFNPLDG